MKKVILLGLILICFLGGSVFADGTGGSGKDVNWQVIDSTGIHAINFTKWTTEIYAVNYDTHPAYVHWVSSTAVSTSCFLLQGYMEDFNQGTVKRGKSRTEKIQSSHFSVRIDSGNPVDFRVQWKMW